MSPVCVYIVGACARCATFVTKKQNINLLKWMHFIAACVLGVTWRHLSTLIKCLPVLPHNRLPCKIGSIDDCFLSHSCPIVRRTLSSGVQQNEFVTFLVLR